MKKRHVCILAALLALFALTLAACGKSEFGVTENTGKLITITAENAEKDSSFLIGSLETEEGEQIEISSALTKGRIRVEIIQAPEEQSADKLPDMDGEAVITADVGPGESASGTVGAGLYMIRATCLEKASGTVQIEAAAKAR